MAVVEPAIKLVRLADGEHKLDASFLEGHTWAEVTEIASKHFKIHVFETGLPVLSDATDAEFEEYKRTLGLVPETGATGTYVEYIVVGEAKATATWERIGTTQADLSNYVKKDTTYTGAALSNGAHTHTVPVNTVTKDATKKLGATASGTAVGADGTDTFVKSYPGTTSKLVTTSIKGVNGSTTASKATAGTEVELAKRATSQTTVGNANVGEAITVATKASTATKVGNADVGTAVNIPNVTGKTSVTTTFVNNPETTVITEVTGKTTGSAASWSAKVESDTDGKGILVFDWTANIPTSITTEDVTNVIRSKASTGTIVENRTSADISLGTPISVTPAKAVGDSSTTIYGCGTDTTVTPAVASTTKIYGVGGTETITPYTFEDVTVPVAASTATTVATGSLSGTGSGAAVMTGLGTATTASALTGVKVTAQPTIKITEDENNTGPVNEHITVESKSVPTSSDGAHTHNLKVTS